MTDEAAFLRAIQANPTDATAKLVYADWLDEHGDPAKAQYARFVVKTGYTPDCDTLPPEDYSALVSFARAVSPAWIELFHGETILLGRNHTLRAWTVEGIYFGI